MLKLTYLSHSAFYLTDGTHRIVIDPFFTGNPKAPKEASDIEPDYVILSHAHGDHLGDGLSLAKKYDATVIAVNELANYAISKGVKAHNMHIGGSYRFPFGRVKFTIAHHGSSTPDGLYMGEPAGIVLTMGGKTVYHTGDTGLFLDMQLIGELDAMDLMLAPIGDNFTMGVDDAVRAVEFVKPKMVVPMHYDTFSVIAADPEDFAAKVRAKGFNAKVMAIGETITL